MSNIILTPLSAKNVKTNGITHSKIAETISGPVFPALYVEGFEEVIVRDGFIYVNTAKLELHETTIIEVKQFLVDNGLSAWLTSAEASGYPASLLQDFQSTTTITFEVNTSPFKLSERHSRTINNLVEIDATTLSRNVISVGSLEYEVQGDLVFVKDLLEPVNCVMEYTVNKYMMFVSRGSVVNSYNTINEQENNNHLVLDLVYALNASNKDTLWQQ